MQSSLAIVTAACSDPELRVLAQRWTERLTEILSQYVDPHTASAIETYLDGATVHAAIRDEPISAPTIARVLTTLIPRGTSISANTMH